MLLSLRRLRQENCCACEASLSCTVSSRPDQPRLHTDTLSQKQTTPNLKESCNTELITNHLGESCPKSQGQREGGSALAAPDAEAWIQMSELSGQLGPGKDEEQEQRWQPDSHPVGWTESNTDMARLLLRWPDG